VVEYERFHPRTRAEWRGWLETHHDHSPGVWVVTWRTGAARPRLGYEDLVEEALCFGWIDSRAKRLDDERSMITMTPRRPGSVWSRSNKERVERLVAQGRMAPAGLRAIEVARANGAWEALDDVDNLVLPDDLRNALEAVERARAQFDGWTASRKKMTLYWIKSAKRPETRARRIAETVRSAADNGR